MEAGESKLSEVKREKEREGDGRQKQSWPLSIANRLLGEVANCCSRFVQGYPSPQLRLYRVALNFGVASAGLALLQLSTTQNAGGTSENDIYRIKESRGRVTL